MNSIYYDEIHRRAKETWRPLGQGNPDPAKNFEAWKQHWLEVAEAWRQECFDQGWMNTVVHLDKIIEENE